MATAPKFRIDVDIHDLLMDSSREPARPAAVKGLTLPEPVFPQCPEKLVDPGPEKLPKNGTGACRTSIGPCADGFSLTYVRACCPANSIPSPPTCLLSTNAISTAGIAGPTTTR